MGKDEKLRPRRFDPQGTEQSDVNPSPTTITCIYDFIVRALCFIFPTGKDEKLRPRRFDPQGTARSDVNPSCTVVLFSTTITCTHDFIVKALCFIFPTGKDEKLRPRRFDPQGTEQSDMNPSPTNPRGGSHLTAHPMMTFGGKLCYHPR